MESVKIIENLDSVWFYSNVMSSSKIQALDSNHEDLKVKSSAEVEKSEPISVIVETHQPQLPLEEVVVTKSGFESRFSTEKEEKEERKRRKSRKRGVISGNNSKLQRGKNETLKEMVGYDLGFDVNEFLMRMELEGYYQRFKNQQNYQSKLMMMMMPPFSDGMAMKQHLKYWAYAVACNVR